MTKVANAAAEALRARGIRSVVWFHTDHWEPWEWEDDRVNEASLKRLESFGRQARSSPIATK